MSNGEVSAQCPGILRRCPTAPHYIFTIISHFPRFFHRIFAERDSFFQNQQIQQPRGRVFGNFNSDFHLPLQPKSPSESSDRLSFCFHLTDAQLFHAIVNLQLILQPFFSLLVCGIVCLAEGFGQRFVDVHTIQLDIEEVVPVYFGRSVPNII